MLSTASGSTIPSLESQSLHALKNTKTAPGSSIACKTRSEHFASTLPSLNTLPRYSHGRLLSIHITFIRPEMDEDIESEQQIYSCKGPPRPDTWTADEVILLGELDKCGSTNY